MSQVNVCSHLAKARLSKAVRSWLLPLLAFGLNPLSFARALEGDECHVQRDLYEAKRDSENDIAVSKYEALFGRLHPARNLRIADFDLPTECSALQSYLKWEISYFSHLEKIKFKAMEICLEANYQVAEDLPHQVTYDAAPMLEKILAQAASLCEQPMGSTSPPGLVAQSEKGFARATQAAKKLLNKVAKAGLAATKNLENTGEQTTDPCFGTVYPYAGITTMCEVQKHTDKAASPEE